jgi:hypothetical protein
MPGKRRKSGVCTMNAAESPIVSGIKEEKKGGILKQKTALGIWKGTAAWSGRTNVAEIGRPKVDI